MQLSQLDIGLFVVIALLFAVIAFTVVYAIGQRQARRDADIKRADVDKQLAEAHRIADQMVKDALQEAKEIAHRENREFDRVQREKNQELQKAEKRIQKREEALERKSEQLDQREKELEGRSESIKRSEQRTTEALQMAEMLINEARSKMENVACLSKEEARQQLIESLEGEARKAVASQVKEIEDEARRTSEDKAKALVATSVQRIANEFVADVCVSVITLPSDDMKGRIIGREGRNIRAIEQATGVDIIIDDTPEAVLISCFNPIRREIAKVAVERLITDGRIHPARIDEVVRKVTTEFDASMREAGERASFDCGIQGLHDDLVMALGRLKYRTTGQQALLQHSVETSLIAGLMAGELDLNVRMARRAGLLHDIGKSLDEEAEGHHSAVGAKLAERCGEPAEVVEAILKHHANNLHGSSPYAVVVQAANSLSAFRPGARKEFLEKSVQRLRDLEGMVGGYDGVEQAYVIRSGREVRAMVSPKFMDDEAVTILARTVAKRIREEAHSNSPVKVTMIRETRFTEIAK